MRKEKLREKFRKIRNRMSKSYRRKASKKITEKLFQMSEFKNAETIALYWSFGSEVDTRAIFKKIFALEKESVFPRINSSKRGMKFCQVADPKKDFIPGLYNILQPRAGLPAVSLNKIDLVLVPGIVFDRRGYRLGYGKGYYDRFLRKVPSALAVGLTYEKTLIKALPYRSADFAVRCIVTERRIYRIEKDHKKNLI